MGTSLDECASYCIPLFEALIDKANAAGLDVVVEDTGRTVEQQSVKLAAGQSWTSNSKHLPQPPEMKSEAIDLVPRAVMALKNWAPGDPRWQQLGVIGESLGLRWGGRWTRLNNGYGDPGHFEYIHPSAGLELA
jgi:hypothetical protein